ncbi:MAG: hypothetical protein H6739_14970 [Alphaproteobacteria bacterium]|nr:hypothetical protein [Alphaproteobacteria bacterium]
MHTDQRWAHSLRAFAEELGDHGPIHAAPTSEVYAWFVVDAPATLVDGIAWKVFLQLDDFASVLTAAELERLLTALHARGFSGDFKIDLRPRYTRFNYNQVIVHTSSARMAVCAEAVAVEVLGERLAATGRGLDVALEGRVHDWHRFLLRSKLEVLSQEARGFVSGPYEMVEEVCPR